jgi:hypothetical protein
MLVPAIAIESIVSGSFPVFPIVTNCEAVVWTAMVPNKTELPFGTLDDILGLSTIIVNGVEKTPLSFCTAIVKFPGKVNRFAGNVVVISVFETIMDGVIWAFTQSIEPAVKFVPRMVRGTAVNPVTEPGETLVIVGAGAATGAT